MKAWQKRHLHRYNGTYCVYAYAYTHTPLKQWVSLPHHYVILGCVFIYPVIELQSQQGWKGPLGTIVHAQSRLLRTVSSLVLNILQRQTASLDRLVACSVTFTFKKSFFLCLNRISSIPLCHCCLLSCHWAPLEESSSIFFALTIRYLCTLIRPPWDYSSLQQTVPVLSASPHMRDDSSQGPSTGLTPVCLYFCFNREPRPGPCTPCVSHQCWLEWKNHLPRPPGHTTPNAAQEAVGSCSTRTPRVFSVRLLSRWSAPSMYWCQGLFLPIGRTLHFPSLNCMRFLLAWFSSLLERQHSRLVHQVFHYFPNCRPLKHIR